VLPATASANADPASDSLYTGTLFLPLSNPVSPHLAQRLAADLRVAGRAGKPVRVALIAAPTDLGGVPVLFGRPAQYARFLGAELQFVYAGRVLVVMPRGRRLPSTDGLSRMPTSSAPTWDRARTGSPEPLLRWWRSCQG
jgi:hypothetical protein